MLGITACGSRLPQARAQALADMQRPLPMEYTQ
jgi:hypothetical protein